MAKFLFYCRRFIVLITLALLAGGGVLWWRVTHPLHKIAVIPTSFVRCTDAGFLTGDLQGAFNLRDWQTGNVLWTVTVTPWRAYSPIDDDSPHVGSIYDISSSGQYFAIASWQADGVLFKIWRDGRLINATQISGRLPHEEGVDIRVTDSGQVFLLRSNQVHSQYPDPDGHSYPVSWLSDPPNLISSTYYVSQQNALSVYRNGRCIASGSLKSQYTPDLDENGLTFELEGIRYQFAIHGNSLLFVPPVSGSRSLLPLCSKPTWRDCDEYGDGRFDENYWRLQCDDHNNFRAFQPSSGCGWTFPNPRLDRTSREYGYDDSSRDGHYAFIHYDAPTPPCLTYLQRKLPFLHLTHRKGNHEQLFLYERPGILRKQALISPDDDRNDTNDTPEYWLSPDGKSVLVTLTSEGANNWGTRAAVLYHW